MATTAQTKAEIGQKKSTTSAAIPAADAKHYPMPVVKLDPPPGASEGLKAFVAMGETAIQTAVDLLGRGMHELPPKVDDLLKPVVYQTLGKGEAEKEYQKTLNKVDARQMKLLMFDNQVVKTSVTVAGEQVRTLRSIMHIVDDLQAKLKAAGTGKLKPTQEAPLLEAVANAVQAVYDKVLAVAEQNENLANGGNGGSGGGTSGGSGGGNTGGGSGGGTGGGGTGGGGSGDGGGSGLGQVLQSLAMLPMMAMPLISQIPAMLQKAEEDKQRKAEQNEQKNQDAGSPPPHDQAPAPGDPTVSAAIRPARRAAARDQTQTEQRRTGDDAESANPDADGAHTDLGPGMLSGN